MEQMLMTYLLISSVAFLASALTFLSGFGLGTLLLPAFSLFFPAGTAVALTAVVHFLNNLFKLGLVGRAARWPVVLRFGIPAIVAAIAGAELLLWLSRIPPIGSYRLGSRTFEVSSVKLVIAGLMVTFATIDLSPRLKNWSLAPRYLSLGGLLTGFVGGLSGHQGALRSAFLVRLGLSKESFIGTGVAIACLVDVSRLSIYAGRFATLNLRDNAPLLVAATASAFIGALLGNRLLKKVTLRAVELTVAAFLFAIAIALGAGLI